MKDNSMRNLLVKLAAAAALSAVPTVSALAHATLERPQAAPGSYKAVLRVPHGCDGKATHTVRVTIPEGYIDVKPMPKPGWELAIEKGAYDHAYKLHGSEVTEGAKTVTWSGGRLDDAHYDEFVLSGTLAPSVAGSTLHFPATQLCDGGEVSWNEIAAPGQNPHELAHPAPSVTVAQADGAEAGHDGHGGHGDHAATEAIHAGDLAITAAWARAMLPGQPAGGGYLTIANGGAAADRLVGAESSAAGKVEIHTMSVVNDVMTMRPVEGGLEIPAGATVELKPGGFHVMFLQVSEPFREGATVPVTLVFEKAGRVEVPFPVRAASGGGGHQH